MPIGNPDSNKINNDSLCNLFNSEEPISIGTTTAYNAYTENDIYSVFYQNRIDNLYNPNTRFLSGYFNLKYNDVKNLKANDLIKINEQYFTWNKIDGFNLTNPELSKVELIQSNNNPSEYPTRYFAYYYCDNPSICYKFKTDFTNPNLRDTNYFWSILYDYYVGILGGNVSGFTSSFSDIQNSTLSYIPYFMYEISKDEYDTSTCSSWDCDTLHNFIYSYIDTQSFSYKIPGFWFSSGINDLPPAANTKQGLNVYSGCTDFSNAASLYGITTGSSTYHGSGLCASPTPTPTITLTPSVTPTITPTPTSTPTFLNGKIIMAGFWFGSAYISTNYGSSFATGTTSNFPYDGCEDIKISNGGIYTYAMTRNVSGNSFSNNYCNTFSLNTNIARSGGGQYDAIGMSKNGKSLIGRYPSGIGNNGVISYSINSGTTFSTNSQYSGGTPLGFGGFATSNNGDYMYVNYGNNILKSTDYGVTFVSGNTQTYNYRSIDCSSNGQYVTTGAYTIKVSSDYGVTYTEKNVINNREIRHISMSSSGQYQLLTNDEDKLYKSSDYGVNWSVVSTPDTPGTGYDTWGCYVNGDGQYQAMAYNRYPSEQNGILLSTNYGVNWTFILLNTTFEDWVHCVAIS
jgi:hypothetical protein